MSDPRAPLALLPSALVDVDGHPVETTAQWTKRRLEIIDQLLPLVYGSMPHRPTRTTVELLHAAEVRRLPGVRLLSCRIATDLGIGLLLRVFLPRSDAAVPVVINGDGCWHYASDAVIASLMARGYGFAQFNRVELAPDVSAVSAASSRGGSGAIAWWAWGFHRVVDALTQLEGIDATRLAVVGHSRGGKAALLAGATDERIAVTSANNSGAGGAGSFRILGPGAETLADITRAFGYWFSQGLSAFAGREQDLPFDQHMLKALVAPRGLLTTEALADHWANPWGTWQTHLAAQPVFDMLNAPTANTIHWRDGGHDHAPEDWECLLAFLDHRFRGAARPAELNRNPFGGTLPTA